MGKHLQGGADEVSFLVELLERELLVEEQGVLLVPLGDSDEDELAVGKDVDLQVSPFFREPEFCLHLQLTTNCQLYHRYLTLLSNEESKEDKVDGIRSLFRAGGT